MSTRSIIVIADGRDAVRLYKHCDGYPTHNLEIISIAIRQTARLYSPGNPDNATVEQIACRIVEQAVGAQKEYVGARRDPSVWGMQCDLEWIYEVDTDAKNINVFGGINADGSRASTIVYRGTVDPLSYVDVLTESYKRLEYTQIGDRVAEIRAAGWTVNGK